MKNYSFAIIIMLFISCKKDNAKVNDSTIYGTWDATSVVFQGQEFIPIKIEYMTFYFNKVDFYGEDEYKMLTFYVSDQDLEEEVGFYFIDNNLGRIYLYEYKIDNNDYFEFKIVGNKLELDKPNLSFKATKRIKV